ncbi:YIP1 family protein [Flavobacterium psychroterrae]|uniref:YIP1 family protein n=1 Tax=Flavobacterium psychroterrae TaxID=2133767 RepID=A0ABS5P9A2_9FLAO|nr:YIP1 family protein [Flavobacterium psychroterrae]MBS7230859.1 YIP1 family protein [Flavobacterium psychroterrae]
MIEENNYQQEAIVNPKNILTKIVTSPKEAFIFINDYKYNKHVTLFLILSGIVSSFDKAISKDMGNNLPLWGVITYGILIGITFGWLINFTYAFSISWTGRLLKGSGDTQAILRVIAYSSLPVITSLFFLSLQILIYGNAIFQSSFFDLYYGLFHTIIYWFFYFADLVLIIWTVVLLVIGTSVAQKISTGKAILNLLLPAFLIMLIALTIFIVVDLLFN